MEGGKVEGGWGWSGKKSYQGWWLHWVGGSLESKWGSLRVGGQRRSGYKGISECGILNSCFCNGLLHMGN